MKNSVETLYQTYPWLVFQSFFCTHSITNGNSIHPCNVLKSIRLFVLVCLYVLPLDHRVSITHSNTADAWKIFSTWIHCETYYLGSLTQESCSSVANKKSPCDNVRCWLEIDLVTIEETTYALRAVLKCFARFQCCETHLILFNRQLNTIPSPLIDFQAEVSPFHVLFRHWGDVSRWQNWAAKRHV